MIEAVIFDFGRVISAQKPDSLFRAYENELGLDPDSINKIMFESEEWKDALCGRKTMDEFWLAVGPELGLKTSSAVKNFQRKYYLDEKVNQEVLDLIRTLYGEYRLAVLSNSPPGLAAWLAEWKMLHFFDVIYCSGDEGFVKPDPVAFTSTLERLGVMANQAVFIDDTLEHVEAARALGIHGIVFSTAENLIDELGRVLGKNFCSCGAKWWKIVFPPRGRQ